MFLVMVLKLYLKIVLIVLFYAIEILINFRLAEELFAKPLPGFETSVLVSNNLSKKIFSSLTTFEQ